VRPTPDELAELTTRERVSFELADLLTREPLTPLASRYLATVMGTIIGACGSRRIDVAGLEHVAPLGPRARLLLLANHRSFFDFFTVLYVLFFQTRLPRRLFFPTRGAFFYDHPAGPVVNLAMSAMRMFPPVLRDARKRAWNDYMLRRTIAELRRPGTIVGLHPEGTRGRGADPYALLPAQPGVGKVALAADFADVVPVFVLGMSNELTRELSWNLTEPEHHRISVRFGAPIDLSDLRGLRPKLSVAKRAADRCLAAIGALAAEDRAERARAVGVG
jgi:1-acyl-sn-glycerol-3-phosphate acyltransferase